jgi:hypothetical protein
MRNVLHIYFCLYLCKESHELWRNKLTNSNTMWMDYNQINLWTGGILQLFIRNKIQLNFNFNFQRDVSFLNQSNISIKRQLKDTTIETHSFSLSHVG